MIKSDLIVFLKNPALWSIKIRFNNPLLDAQNAGNRISELLDFKFFWGSMPADAPRGKGPYGPFSGHSRLLNLQWPLITNVIQTPGGDAFYPHFRHLIARWIRLASTLPCSCARILKI